MVGTPCYGVPARVIAGGTNDAHDLNIAQIAPLNAALTAQRAVPTQF